MKNIFPVFLNVALILFFASCKKDGELDNYYIKASFNGELKNFAGPSVQKTNSGDTSYSMNISSFEGFTITLLSEKDDFQAGKTFGVGHAIMELTGGGFVGNPYDMWSSSYPGVSETLSITITKATSTYVKGTFSGILYYQNSNPPESQHVSEGSFTARYY